MSQYIETATSVDGVATILWSNPPLNILTRALLAELRDELKHLQEDSLARVVLLTAQGKHFSAGADVGEHLPPQHTDLIREFLDTVRAVYDCPLPVVAAVRGRCLGAGCELITAADVVVAGEGAMFGQPEILLGVFPPAACALLPVMGEALAADMVLTGDSIDAQDALRSGLVRRVVEDDEVEDAALAVAKRIARHSRTSLVYTKKALREGRSGNVHRALEHAESIYLDELMSTSDAVEGLQAFLDARSPSWSHR